MWTISAHQSNEWYVLIGLSKYQPNLSQLYRLNYVAKTVDCRQTQEKLANWETTVVFFSYRGYSYGNNANYDASSKNVYLYKNCKLNIVHDYEKKTVI